MIISTYFVCTLRLPAAPLSDHDNQNLIITLLSYLYHYLLYLIVLDYTCLILCLYFAIACSAAQLEAFTCRSLLIIIGNCWHQKQWWSLLDHHQQRVNDDNLCLNCFRKDTGVSCFHQKQWRRKREGNLDGGGLLSEGLRYKTNM